MINGVIGGGTCWFETTEKIVVVPREDLYLGLRRSDHLGAAAERELIRVVDWYGSVGIQVETQIRSTKSGAAMVQVDLSPFPAMPRSSDATILSILHI